MLVELRDADPEGGGLPRYVERELAAYLKCGILAHGFARVRCQAWPDGRAHLMMEPAAFLRRLCGIIPPPRRHLVHYIVGLAWTEGEV